METGKLQWAALCAVVGGLGVGLWPAEDTRADEVIAAPEALSAELPARGDAPADEQTPAPTTAQTPPPSRAAGRFPGLQIETRTLNAEGRYEVNLSDGSVAILSLDPALQSHVEERLQAYEVPFGALVAVEPRTGRVLAQVSHSSLNPEAGDLTLDPSPPAASIFKIITAAALVDAGVDPHESVCYSGGLSGIQARHLEDTPSDRCVDLFYAMGHSTNVVFAKQADRHLDVATLTRYAHAFGFGHALPYDLPTRASPVEVPSERLEFARTAAGFWHTQLSPLHGAMIAATIANEGEMPVLRVVDAWGAPGAQNATEARMHRRVISRRTARLVRDMMERTVHDGTAKSAFFDPQGRAFLPNVTVAGKTGSLSSNHPYRAYSWFVGFAPADDPQIAVAALIVNTPQWRIKASYLAREAMRNYLIR